METKQKWELIINTAGDPLKNILTLDGNLIPCSEVNVISSGDGPAYLVIKVPIIDGNLDIKTDTIKPVDREIIVASSKKE
ncbi:MAG TPA: hypothetical protein VI911_09980 [Patescibacteria group bacterium]|nr:hypothetical protein [Patescibacteria group bacterium]